LPVTVPVQNHYACLDGCRNEINTGLEIAVFQGITHGPFAP
jgi:hypothetical protein